MHLRHTDSHEILIKLNSLLTIWPKSSLTVFAAIENGHFLDLE